MPDGYTLKEIVQKLDEKVEKLDISIRNLEQAVTLLTELANRVESLEKQVSSNSRFITYVTGAWAVVAGILGLIGRDIITKLFH